MPIDGQQKSFSVIDDKGYKFFVLNEKSLTYIIT